LEKRGSAGRKEASDRKGLKESLKFIENIEKGKTRKVTQE